MPLWGKTSQSNNIPIWSADLVSSGSNNAGKVIVNTSLFNNTTPNAFIQNETDSIILVTDSDIVNGTIKVQAGPGWYLKRVGSGGRTGKVSYEALVVFAATPGTNTSPSPSLSFDDGNNSSYIVLIG